MQLQLLDPEKTRVMESLMPEATNLPLDSRQSRLSFSLLFTSILLPAMDDLSFSTSPNSARFAKCVVFCQYHLPTLDRAMSRPGLCGSD